MKQNPLVSIITLNYNKAGITRDLLRSLRQITYPSIEIIVVDNASVDRSIEALKDDFPEITLINSPQNLGFAGGNNIGLKVAKGDLLLLINNDTEVTPGFLEPMVRMFQEVETAGMVSPKILYYHTPNLIQYAGSDGINRWTGRGKKQGNLETDEGQYNYNSQTALVHGACVLVSRALINTVGLLDESYFVYYEEHDWAERARSLGYTMHYAGNSTIYHKESATIGKESPFKTFYMTRNRILFLRRNVPYPAFLVAIFVFIFLAVPKKLLEFSVKRNLNNLDALMRGIMWHVGLKSKIS